MVSPLSHRVGLQITVPLPNAKAIFPPPFAKTENYRPKLRHSFFKIPFNLSVFCSHPTNAPFPLHFTAPPLTSTMSMQPWGSLAISKFSSLEHTLYKSLSFIHTSAEPSPVQSFFISVLSC